MVVGVYRGSYRGPGDRLHDAEAVFYSLCAGGNMERTIKIISDDIIDMVVDTINRRTGYPGPRILSIIGAAVESRSEAVAETVGYLVDAICVKLSRELEQLKIERAYALEESERVYHEEGPG